MIAMGPDDIPLFGMLKSRLGYLADRQKVVAQNVANASTPGYAPRDLKAYSFQASLMNQGSGEVYRGGKVAPTSGVAMMATSAALQRRADLVRVKSGALAAALDDLARQRADGGVHRFSLRSKNRLKHYI